MIVDEKDEEIIQSCLNVVRNVISVNFQTTLFTPSQFRKLELTDRLLTSTISNFANGIFISIPIIYVQF